MKNNFSKYINPTILVCFINCFIVFIFYAHTLGYSWKYFDDNIIFQELVLPIPKSFSEIFEYITLFGLNNHFEASNPFYSSIANLRSDPFNFFIMLFVLCLFQKNIFFYHLLSLCLHIFNTCLLFLILDSIYFNFIKKDSAISNKLRFTLTSSLTLFWALNPLNVESVLFTTNWTALLTYFFCLLIFHLMISWDFTNYRLSKLSIVFVLFLLSLFTCEYSITLPIIIFSYLFAKSIYFNNTSIKAAVKTSLEKILPLLSAIIPFLFYFLFSQTRSNLISPSIDHFQLFLERIFWLSPQIFFHFIKLILFPCHLSIDQPTFVNLSRGLFEPYSILCSIFMYALLLLAFILLFNLRRTSAYLYFISFVPFFAALLPFLHIISPLYNLASERYLYLPLFFLILGLANTIFFLLTQFSKDKFYKYSLIILLLIGTFIYSYRAHLRTLDWKDSFTLLQSTVNNAPNNLFKGLRQEMTSASMKTLSEVPLNQEASYYSKEALISLRKALLKFKKQIGLYEYKSPLILKFYGLDPKTLLAKTAFLIAFTNYDLNNDPEKAYKIFSPYVNYLIPLDSEILNFYYKILFQTKRIDEAEVLLLQNLKQNKISPVLYLALSDLSEYKYNDLKQTEKYLLLSNKYFPYESATLFGLRRLYRKLNNAEKFAFYSYLYGLRIHDSAALKDAAYIYTRLGHKNTAKKIMQKLLKYYPADTEISKIKVLYEQTFGVIKE